MQKEIKFVITQCKLLLSYLFKKYDKQLPYMIISALAVLLVIGGISLFLELTENLKTDQLAFYDTIITDYIISFRSSFLTRYFQFFTDVGDIYGYLIMFILCFSTFFLAFKSSKYVVQLSVVMVLALSSNLVLKEIIQRARPSTEHLVSVETLSYPSGHAMTAMAFYGFLIFLFYQFKINILVKSLLITLAVILILSIGISRIYLGVHYPSDVVGGFIAGFIWVIFCALIFNILRLFRKDIRT
jgi:undecaprenyl-diphosphatase